MPASSIFPAAIATLANFFAEQPSQPANELVLQTSIIATDLSIVATTAIPTSWPQPGKLIIDGEVIKYTSYAGSTFTVASTGDRGQETAYGAAGAGSHTAGAVIGSYVTALTVAQMIAELISIENQLGVNLGNVGVPVPNLVPNSDFGRRNFWAYCMEEAFPDVNAWTGGSPSVASNTLTQATASVWTKWTGPNTMFRDARWSAQFKMGNAAGVYALGKYVDANDARNTGNVVYAQFNNGNFQLIKLIAGVGTTVATVAQAGTLNNFFWLELECQGSTYIAKLYNSGAASALKTSSTLLQTLTGSITDTAVVSGGVAMWSDQASNQWGAQAAAPGGVYVEMMRPESWNGNYTSEFTGVLGGQAFGYDESADAGPLGKQWALRVYIPNASRGLQLNNPLPPGSVSPSISHTGSVYMKVSGKGGTGVLGRTTFYETAADGTSNPVSNNADEAGETAWTRKTVTFTSASTTRRATIVIQVNPSSTATGTVYYDLFQLEQSGGATTWRNHTSDSDPIVWSFMRGSSDISVTAANIEADSSLLAGNLFFPWDCKITMDASCVGQHASANGNMRIATTVDGTQGSFIIEAQAGVTNVNYNLCGRFQPVNANQGKHRCTLNIATDAGTFKLNSLFYWQQFYVTATRGK